jgi:hypothetical protein
MRQGAVTALRAARESMAIAQRNLTNLGDMVENITTGNELG